MFVQFKDGKEIGMPLTYFPRLFHATDQQRNEYELWNDGKWIHWEKLDEDLSAEGFLQYDGQTVANS